MLDWKKHKVIMLKILKDIYNNIAISSSLGFKGGTACLLFYNLPRYSVDLDFDLLDSAKSSLVYKEVAKIISKYGKITDQASKKYTLLFELSYGSGERRLKIEINLRPVVSSWQVLNYLGVPMKVMQKKDMFAGKLLALVGRKTPATRDIFDLHYFYSQNWDINESIITEQTNKSLPEYLKKCINIIEKFSSRTILFGLGDLVDEKQKTWIRNNLKKDLIFLIKAYL